MSSHTCPPPRQRSAQSSTPASPSTQIWVSEDFASEDRVLGEDAGCQGLAEGARDELGIFFFLPESKELLRE